MSSIPPLPQSTGSSPQESQRVLCGILGILLGGLGIHRFVLGDVTGGVLRLLLSLRLLRWRHHRPDRGHHLPDQVRCRVHPDLSGRKEALVLIAALGTMRGCRRNRAPIATRWPC